MKLRKLIIIKYIIKTIKIYKCKKDTQRERLQFTHDHHNVACVIRVCWVCCVMEKATLSTILICHAISNLIKKSKSSYSKHSNNACDLLHVCNSYVYLFTYVVCQLSCASITPHLYCIVICEREEKADLADPRGPLVIQEFLGPPFLLWTQFNYYGSALSLCLYSVMYFVRYIFLEYLQIFQHFGKRKSLGL